MLQVSFAYMRTLAKYLFFLIICFLVTQKVAAQSTPTTHQSNTVNLSKEELINTYSDDSSKAIINLFYRKRKGASWRGAIGGGLAGFSAGSAIGAGDVGSAYIGPLIFSPLIITSITQNAKYKQSTLLLLLDQHKNGNSFPRKFSKKLNKNDFNP